MGCGIGDLNCSGLSSFRRLVAQMGEVPSLPEPEEDSLPIETTYSNDLYVGVSGQRTIAIDNRVGLNIKYTGDNSEVSLNFDLVARYRRDFEGLTLVGSQLPVAIEGKTKEHYLDLLFSIRQASFSYYLSNWTFKGGYVPVQESITEFPLYIITTMAQELANPFIPARNKVVPGVSVGLSVWENKLSLNAYYSPFAPKNSIYFDSNSLDRVMGLPVSAESVSLDLPGDFETDHNFSFSSTIEVPSFAGLRISALYNFTAWPSPTVESFLPTGNKDVPYEAKFKYPQRHQTALSATGSFWWLSFWAQGAFSFTDPVTATAPNPLGQLQTKEGEEHQLEIVAGLKLHKPDSPFYVSGQYSRLDILQNGGVPQHIASLRVEATFLNDDLQFGVEGDYFVKYERPIISAGVKYRVSDSFLLEGGFRYADRSIPVPGWTNQGYVKIQYSGGN
ncbi:hypothetical protein A2291_00925 [candidate division WOR-1 bacterium RIFOXYB2_FULL_42_35]|uniref:Uncharacterized protein n=1 Tax=candidate division WOR-1 bacterium RIFOXYC2_FULL_41_25 TaxID=1802586 RepID=A0A1F4TLI7_UNCSA|nr:MAG: hypothetical protein A2247_05910 [candidate division WOR-1 bacterium RIFOXYA2_FULL_41_14]OGC23618.1 MAG: hypothetical protein A2291_00925 [candidate division WOR-1 bacterium RIFOXYB2_FULL_42_35]OGC33582.1 MAG: hypothetical protein A2462_02740 [candidate division WOR-1 bacterium RIFOXYC2_FULL_41_25]OGC41748.1 MAG: hypothetical protein A2548_03295 [candidate division WOR-1 bacterium RIFOXYD2_FULL_41_8]